MTEASTARLAAMSPSERRAVGLVALIATLRMFGLFALLPVLAVYAADLAGATPLLIGLAVGGYGLTQALLQVPFGAWSDRIGRVPVILAGLALFAAGSIVAASSDSIYGVIAGRLLQGAGAISATLTALLADTTRESVRTRSMALLGIAIGTSFLLALIAGPLLAAAGGVRLLFWTGAGLALAAALLLAWLPQPVQPVPRAARMPVRHAFRPELLRLDLFVFLLHAMLTASFVALPFLLRGELGLPLASHWQIYVAALALSLLPAVPLIVADDRRGKDWTVTAAVLLLVAGLAWLVLAGDTTWRVIAGLALFFGGFNFLEAALPARLSILAAGEVRGAALGAFSSSQFGGAFAGGLLGGLLLAGGRPGVVLAGCLLLALAWLALLGLGAQRAKSAQSAKNRAGI